MASNGSVSRYFGLVLVLVAGALTLALPASAIAVPRTVPELSRAGAGPHADGSLGPAARQARRQGYLVPDQQAYEAAKASAAAESGRPPAPDAVAGTLAPVNQRGWLGIHDPTRSPSDSTSAVGQSRFIELVNIRVAIYDKTSNTPLSQRQLSALAKIPGAEVFDPQVIWDPQTRRFFYAMDAVVSATDNRIAVGFSKTASPSDPDTDFCHYEISYGSEFPDYPKLGDTNHFILLGVNTFLGNNLVGSDALAVTKPPAGTTCPSAATLGLTIERNLAGPGGPAFTPVPANQTDAAGSGWIVARTIALPSKRLVLFKVTRNPTTGDAVFQNPGTVVTVPTYNVPPNAPQLGSNRRLDTLDARPTQAVSAIDPTRANRVGLWTQHTVSHPTRARAEVRWYEINPPNSNLFQSDEVRTPRFNFNAAISPDRAVNGSVKSGGDAMVLGYSTTSHFLNPEIRTVSKIGAGTQSGEIKIKTSPGFYAGFDCPGSSDTCRWGDYSGATPDPNPPGGVNRVWLTNTFASGGTSTAQSNWRTWNWIARP